MIRSTPRPSSSSPARGRGGSARPARAAELAERADRAGDEDVRARDLARLAGQPDAGGVDPLQLVLEEVAGQLAAVRPERVRLDQLGAGEDEARVEGDDALGSAQVRLFGAADPRHGLREERAHAAVGDDRRPVAEALFEAARHPLDSMHRAAIVRCQVSPSPRKCRYRDRSAEDSSDRGLDGATNPRSG